MAGETMVFPLWDDDPFHKPQVPCHVAEDVCPAGNLWVFGDDIEEALGPWRFLLFYFVAGIAAELAFVAVNPSSTVPMVGASGVISGVLAVCLTLRPCAKVTVLFFPRRLSRARVLGDRGLGHPAGRQSEADGAE
jgi:hypothetical protein